MKVAIGNMERRLADTITSISGSMLFVYLHVVWLAMWFLAKLPVQVLNLILSVEAIFLATFIMISQNREQEIAQQRLAVEEAQEARSEEDIDDIQKELDDLQQDIGDVKRLISRIEQRTAKVSSEHQPTRPQPIA